VLVPSSEVKSSDISFMKFWVIFIHFTGNGFFGSQACMIDGANLNTFKCIIEHEFDRLQLLFITGIIFPFCMCKCARVIQRLAFMSLFVFEKLVK